MGTELCIPFLYISVAELIAYYQAFLLLCFWVWLPPLSLFSLLLLYSRIVDINQSLTSLQTKLPSSIATILAGPIQSVFCKISKLYRIKSPNWYICLIVLPALNFNVTSFSFFNKNHFCFLNLQ